MSNLFMELGSGSIPWYLIVIVAVCVYFLGNINPAIIIGRAKGIDIRAQGSGNAGATNAMRSLGKKAGAVTFAIDVLKGWAGYYLPFLFFMNVPAMFGASGTAYMIWLVPAAIAASLLCGLCVVLGHMYPVVFGFRGGKGVATTFGVLLAVSPLYALILLAIVLVLTAIFRYVSLSVMVAVIAALILVFWGGYFAQDCFFYYVGFLRFDVYQPLWVIIIMALVVWKHRGNIERLVKGQESKISFGSGKKGSKG